MLGSFVGIHIPAPCEAHMDYCLFPQHKSRSLCHRDISQHHHLVDSLILLLKNKVSSIQCSQAHCQSDKYPAKNGANSLLVNVDIPI